ncbi:MAG: globin-coupled sensor protein, partial [Hyphomicrobiaceae bacterium]|nr:globin-coupled sensor protein [Hyphomicrobiaceae bacterium]
MSSNANIARRNAFNRMDEQSVATLRQHKPRIMELLGAILVDFYAHLSKFPETQRMFRDTGHAERAKGAQVQHWSLICDARFDDAYEASVRRIGHTHHRLGLTTEWYIGGYNFLMTEFLTRLAAELGMVASAAKRKEIADIQAAFTKAALYDMSVAISIYLDAEKKEKEVTLASLASMFQDSIGSIVMSVTSAAQQLKGAAASMNDVAVDAANQANIVSASSEETSTNVHAVAAATEELSTSVREISQTVSTSAQIGQEAVRNAVNTVAKVQELSDAASKIGTII